MPIPGMPPAHCGSQYHRECFSSAIRGWAQTGTRSYVRYIARDLARLAQECLPGEPRRAALCAAATHRPAHDSHYPILIAASSVAKKTKHAQGQCYLSCRALHRVLIGARAAARLSLVDGQTTKCALVLCFYPPAGGCHV